MTDKTANTRPLHDRRGAGEDVLVVAVDDNSLSAILARAGIGTVRGRPSGGIGADAAVIARQRLGRAERASIRELRTRLGDVAVVVVLAEITPRTVHDALDAGANAVVAADAAEHTLAAAVRAALAGLATFPATTVERFVRPALSTRERQVLALVVMGHGNGSIAARLHIAESTVKTHLSSIFEKLGVRSRNEATSAVLEPSRGLGLGVLAITKLEAVDV